MKIYHYSRSAVKRERFVMLVYFSNGTVFPDNCDNWTNEMFRLEHETLNVCFITSISATLLKKS